MLDIKVATQLENERLMTTALCYKDGEWIYESILWDQREGKVITSRKFSQDKQLEALAYHVQACSLLLNAQRKSSTTAPEYDECVP